MFNIEENVKRISVTTSMPTWIVEKLLEEKNVEEVEEICKNSNLRPKLTIRINTLKTNKEKLKQELKIRDIEFEETELEDFLTLNKLKNIEELDLFKQGEFTVQDLSAGLPAIVLNPKENDKVLDACSAPGGKTTYMAELMENHGEIEAWDIHEHRINLVKQNAKRLGIHIINTNINDATNQVNEFIEKFDKILLDVPCLGIGVIKRKPDIKWQRTKEDIEEISKIQLEILKTCSKYLRKGGELVYSTCSILKEENEKIIEKFLNENKEFEYSKYDNMKNFKEVKKFVKNAQYISINTDMSYDGFFICKLIKK